MGSEHYCLRWNNHQSNLLGVFSQLLESESLVDVTLACTEGPSIRAHKVVLSACSSYFQALFLDHPNRHPIVILKDVRFAELRTLVDFMYKGEVNVEYCQLSALLKTAESLKVKGLADMTNINAAAVQASKEEQSQQQQSAQSQQTTGSSSSTTTTTTTTTATPVAAEPMVQDAQDERHHHHQQQQQQQQPQQQQQQQQHSSASRHDGKQDGRERERNHDRDRDCRDRDRDRERDREKERDKRETHSSREQQEPQQQQQTQQTSSQQQRERERDREQRERDREHNLSVNECSTDEVEISECPVSPAPTTTRTSRGAAASPCPGPLALDRPRSRRDSDSAASLEETRGSLSPLSVHSGPSDMSLSNNTSGGGAGAGGIGGGVTPVTIPISSLSQSRLPSPHSTEPLAGPSGLPPVQQVPLSLKKEVDWERSTEERSASSEMSSDYRLPPDPVSLALGLEPAGWGGLSPGELGEGLLSSAGFAAGLAGLARRCGVCLASFPSSWLLERHAILQHAGQPSDDKPFTCEQCGQRYRYRSAYVKHREQNHRARLPADKLFTCDVCGMQFRYLKSFKKHRLNHALERLQRAPSSEAAAALTERSDQVSSTGEPSQLESGSAGDASPLQPDPEDRPGGRDSPLEAGREEAASSETASLQENPADEPRGAGPQPGSDAEDAAMELDERLEPEASTTSAAGAETSLNLTVARPASAGGLHHHHHHHEAERRERRFACPFCGKCVRSKENLKLHVRKHTGERPFVCLFCGRAFGGKSDLTRHLRIHTGERPYHCEMCGKCFARADYLSKHLTTHIHQR